MRTPTEIVDKIEKLKTLMQQTNTSYNFTVMVSRQTLRNESMTAVNFGMWSDLAVLINFCHIWL